MAPIWQSPLWPRFQHDSGATQAALAKVMHRIGHVRGLQEGLSAEDSAILLHAALTEEIAASLTLDGLPVPAFDAASHPLIAGPVTTTAPLSDLLDHIRNGQAPMTAQRLHHWHNLLCRMADGSGQWRASPLEIVGAHDEVLYAAPPPDRVPGAVTRMIDWLNLSDLPDPVRAALVHLWCDTIQPYDDGSGVIARALADHALMQRGALPIALSPVFAVDRRGYFAALQAGRQHGADGIDATPFVLWFLSQLDQALARAETSLRFVVMRNRFFLRFRNLPPRADSALSALFAAGPGAVADGLTASQYADLAPTSIPTGTRDLAELEGAGVLRRGAGGGRSTRYHLVL